MKNSVKELTEGMQRLCAIANRIVAHEGEVSQIERDLLLDDLRKLYDVALRLESSNATLPASGEEAGYPKAEMDPDEEILSSTVMATMAAMAPEPAPAEPEKPAAPAEPEPQAEPAEPDPPAEPEKQEPPVEQPRMEELENNDNALLFDEIIIEEPAPEPQEVHEEPAPEPQEVHEEPAPEPQEVHEEPAPEPAQPAAGMQASLLDYLKRPAEEKPVVKTLGEKLGENGHAPQAAATVTAATPHLGEQLNSKKVSDLRTVININDKFSFMSELFHNNMKAYNDFILRLNAIDTRDEALMCVNEVSAQYKWDENSMAVQSFYKVFDKKF